LHKNHDPTNIPAQLNMTTNTTSHTGSVQYFLEETSNISSLLQSEHFIITDPSNTFTN